MTVTIDAAGRIVVPKALRDAAQLRPGMALEVRLRDGRLEIEPVVAVVTVEDRGGIAVAVSAAPLPRLSLEDVEATREALRDGRG